MKAWSDGFSWPIVGRACITHFPKAAARPDIKHGNKKKGLARQCACGPPQISIMMAYNGAEKGGIGTSKGRAVTVTVVRAGDDVNGSGEKEFTVIRHF